MLSPTLLSLAQLHASQCPSVEFSEQSDTTVHQIGWVLFSSQLYIPVDREYTALSKLSLMLPVIYYASSLSPTFFLLFSSSPQVKSLTTHNTTLTKIIVLPYELELSFLQTFCRNYKQWTTEQGQLKRSTVYCLSNSWHRVNNNGQSNCLSSSCRPVGNPATVKLASQ